jgi:hypothetical protein
MASYSWYWHRLRAMSPGEIWGRVQKKWFQWVDSRSRPDWDKVHLVCPDGFPTLPDPAAAPEELREELRRDTEAIGAGRWQAFGHLPIQVDNPPHWHRDYLAGVDLRTNRSAFQLNHRDLPGGADIKLIWELSRWYQLGRLAMAAFVRQDTGAGRTCLVWLEDWVQHNPPCCGWNWTSALETGIRLVQFTWIHALLGSSADAGEFARRLETLARAILPAHGWFTWRHRSFGSSANNHLLGELAGLIFSVARWPGLARWSVGLERLHTLWEREVLAQFAPDGGNREQALNYHLFSFELCWQTRLALLAARREIDPAVEERLARAAEFYAEVQMETDAWDYGDSDNAFVTWWFAGRASAVAEWLAWLRAPTSSPALCYWLGDRPRLLRKAAWVPMARDWRFYPDSGQAICRRGSWTLRWDTSRLGYLSTAAHGHLDALHLSLWRQGVAFLVDPGTGAYYSDAPLRTALASWDAHNGPHPAGLNFPRRLGPFLWSEHHAPPEMMERPEGGLTGCLTLPMGKVCRLVSYLSEKDAWQVDDQYRPGGADTESGFVVCWQFAPGTELVSTGGCRYRARRAGTALEVVVGENWAEVKVIQPASPASGGVGRTIPPGVCSPGFRQTAFGPQLRLRAQGHNPCLFRTTFLACADS